MIIEIPKANKAKISQICEMRLLTLQFWEACPLYAINGSTFTHLQLQLPEAQYFSGSLSSPCRLHDRLFS